MVFCLLAIVVLSILIPFTIGCYYTYWEYVNGAPEGYKFPEMKDFRLTLISALVIAVTQSFLERFFYMLFEPICRVQDDPIERQLRSQKASK